MLGILRLALAIAVTALLAVACKSGQNTTDTGTPVVSNSVTPSAPIAAPPSKIMIPPGTPIRIVLIDGVSSRKNSPGDKFAATVADTIQIDGKTVLEKGTRVQGQVFEANPSGRVQGRASLNLGLIAIVRGDQNIPIETKPLVLVAKSIKKRDTAVIAGGTGIGAAIGAIAGGGKGAAIGAAIGGGAGTGEVLATKGKDINYPPESKLNFTLASAVEL